MITPEDCNRNILTRGKTKIPGLEIQHTQFATYSPELLLSCTPSSDLSRRVVYISQVDHQGLSIVFTRDKTTPTSEVLELSFSGGNTATRYEVLSGFEAYLGIRQEQEGWQSIVPAKQIYRF